jgi:signal transduction histidine kinase
MAEPSQLLSRPDDPKGKLVSVFVGAVLLPSVALSLVSFYAIPRQAEGMRGELIRRAYRYLRFLEEDLEHATRERALAAARAVGIDDLLDGSPARIHQALGAAGLSDGGQVFETFRLEASSPTPLGPAPPDPDRDMGLLREALNVYTPASSPSGEDAIPLSGGESRLVGMLRFRFCPSFAHGRLLTEFFERDVKHADQAMVVRVTDPSGAVLYETAPTPDGRFEATRTLATPSFRGLKVHLRYKDRSIEEDVRRAAIGKTILIAFIDLALGAGLYLVYANVRREMHLSKLKSDFVANVSHELKTPLALIRLFAETLELGRVPTQERARHYYRVIHKESQRLTQLINNILDFSRIEAGKKEYRLGRADVSRIVADVVEAYRYPIEHLGFKLDVEIAPDLPELEVDAEALSQALINLLNNAVKYSREDKHIRVEVRQEGERVLISVADRGIGVAKSEQVRIFEKFFRAQDTLVHETRGSGLGLTIVRHTMDAHGGSVEVDSAPGRGSTFTLALPVGKEAEWPRS